MTTKKIGIVRFITFIIAITLGAPLQRNAARIGEIKVGTGVFCLNINDEANI